MMIWLTLALAALFTLYVGIIIPLQGKRRYQTFLSKVATDPAARSHYYVRNVSMKWLLLGVLALIMLIGSIPPPMLGLRAPDGWNATIWLLVEFVALFWVAHVVTMWVIAKTQRPGPAFFLLAVKELLPRTTTERWLWLLVSITAGICEEIIFRGFLPWYFLTIGSYSGIQISYIVAFFFSTLLFGFVHLYQGWKGVIATALLGMALAYFYVSTGSLLVSILIHIQLDLRVMFLTPLILNLDKGKQKELVY